MLSLRKMEGLPISHHGRVIKPAGELAPFAIAGTIGSGIDHKPAPGVTAVALNCDIHLHETSVRGTGRIEAANSLIVKLVE